MRRRPLAAAMMVGLLFAGGSAGGSAAASPAASRRLPGAVPNVRLDTLIHGDQLHLIARRQDVVVTAAQRRSTLVERTLATDQAALAHDRAVTASAGRAQAEAAAATTRDASALSVAVAAHHRAARAVASARRRLQAIAVGWYTGGAAVNPLSSTALNLSQADTNADAELLLLTGLTTKSLRRDVAAARSTQRRATEATTTLQLARTVLATDRNVDDHAAAVLAGASALVVTDRAAVASARATLVAAVGVRARLVGSFDGSEGDGRSPVPSILGRAAMTAGQIVTWFDDMGYQVATRATIQQLASWYISEGRAEGVRGDIAFAQAVVETGEFDSPDAVKLNNYAGIGHCDNCGRGLRFGSALAGVRTHIQLLRTWADPTLTTADLPSPPPLARLAPQDQGDRGCCRTWNSLTGVWATDTQYGTTVLEVYAEMLGSAVDDGAAAGA